jgi:quercetin dioxygenase-like cupin family protein
MKHSPLVFILAVLPLFLAACAAKPAALAPTAPAPAIDGVPVRAVEFPASAGTGQPKELHVLVDEPALKLVTIVLRQGTVLPEHHAPMPVTIQALQGAGTVIAGATRLRLDPTHAVVLAAKVPHAIEPDAGTDLVLLVHHLGNQSESHP